MISSDEETDKSLEEVTGEITDDNLPFWSNVETYEKFVKIGQGTFGEVFKARHTETRKVVALKRVLLENVSEGFPLTAIREMKILKRLKHENVVNFIETYITDASCNPFKTKFYLVFDFCEHDLAGLLSNPDVKFTLGEIKMVMKQLFHGLYFIHSNKILHRDIKAANILITKTGTLKIANFGMARKFSDIKTPDNPNTFTVVDVTLWYRPPELLLGERNYGPAVDIWGSGCVMAEMWTRTPIMQGNTEQHQLMLISQLCGSITAETFPGCEKLDLWAKLVLPKDQKRILKDRLKAYVEDPHALDLLDKLLTIDPAKRIDSEIALNHDFFWTDPLPCELTKMLQPHTQSMFQCLYATEKKSVKRHCPGISGAHPTANDEQCHDRVF